ncbi:MAG: prepilin-type N-terminal cleavage/methylation domain-containing protein [Hydrogenovibrio sp.]|uniref:prepilin-type N-terminal cleavage/methylation domain-containing protein n=1 Tax=Hydrogenovibrio sp. TaxID=2065821 RepID=UPI00287043BA|nr:prepilin-type N-terminal cleavage/methylation domain-containing protein [Hydrogenovibrio sp.]MDR9497815.1 prepilin-type N-terminal cleavage/methylation domain-containing protein [Hydrogenovibrio sp.]
MAEQRMKKYRGFTLVELSISLVVVGLVVALVSKIIPEYTESTSKEISVDHKERINKAIEGFVYVHNRLPFPSQEDGLEDSTLNKGLVPYRSLGLSELPKNEAGLPMRYAVHDAVNTNTWEDSALAELKSRFEAYFLVDFNHTSGSYSFDVNSILPNEPSSSNSANANKTPLNTAEPNGLDFCQALYNGMNDSSLGSSSLHIGSGTSLQNVAYVIHDLGLGSASGNTLSDGSNTDEATDYGFDDPTVLKDDQNNDRVYVKTFDQLWNQFRCQKVMATIGRSHPNIVSASAIMNQAIEDYEVQLILSDDLADADIAGAAAGIANAASGLAAAAATIPIGISEALNTSGGMAFTIGLGSAAVAAATAGVVAAAVSTASAAANKCETERLLYKVQGGTNTTCAGSINFNDGYLTGANDLHIDTYENLNQADLDGLYQQ